MMPRNAASGQDTLFEDESTEKKWEDRVADRMSDFSSTVDTRRESNQAVNSVSPDTLVQNENWSDLARRGQTGRAGTGDRERLRDVDDLCSGREAAGVGAAHAPASSLRYRRTLTSKCATSAERT